MPDSWIVDVEYRIRSLAAERGTRWVVAVSGGSDSVGLLRILHGSAPAAGLELSVAHLDHGTRAEASAADAAFAAALADDLGLPFDLGHWRATRSAHFEADARQARYAWLTEVARGRGASIVAAGHTRDDQAETILHRIVRGTGIRGLAGIPEQRPLADDPRITLARPLLAIGRVEIRAYLEGLDQSFREDATNADIARTRSRIRHDLIPKLEAEYNPLVSEALARLGEMAAASSALLDDQLREREAVAIVEVSPSCIVLDRRCFEGLGRFATIELMRRAWARAGWPERAMSTARWNRLHDLAAAPSRRGRLSVGSGIDACLDAPLLTLTRSPP